MSPSLENVTVHPDVEILGRYALGRLDPKTTDEVVHHLARCEACCRIVAAAPDDDLMRLLRRVRFDLSGT